MTLTSIDDKLIIFMETGMRKNSKELVKESIMVCTIHYVTL